MQKSSMTTTSTVPENLLGTELGELPQKSEIKAEFVSNLSRSRSDGCILGRIPSTISDADRENIVLESCPLMTPANSPEEYEPLERNNPTKKIKKDKKKGATDYKKNICGYITKKIIREFTNQCYFQKVKQFCDLYHCDYNKAKAFYMGKIEQVTGPSHIPALLIPECPQQVGFKMAFRDFFEWFLKERYLRYLLIEGKMSCKKAYIAYKNTQMLHLVRSKNIKMSHQLKEEQDQKYNRSSLKRNRPKPSFMQELAQCKIQMPSFTIPKQEPSSLMEIRNVFIPIIHIPTPIRLI